MSLLGTSDRIYAFRFLRLLTMSWNKTAAFKVGVIDKEGKTIKTPETKKEKDAYTYFHRIAFNVRRLIQSLPGGKSKIASYIGALFLLKEHTGLDEDDIKKVLMEAQITSLSDLQEDESCIDLNGQKFLNEEIVSPKTGYALGAKGDSILIKEEYDTFMGRKIYTAIHEKSGKECRVTLDDIQ